MNIIPLRFTDMILFQGGQPMERCIQTFWYNTILGCLGVNRELATTRRVPDNKREILASYKFLYAI
ncbi:hypothetical protein BDV37DRAFT_253506 [Aspergillus pseudonomiae]|uniref:Uncharacterized protein n=1 Tax=Aspergillus pseudonomiae TaxID=1506151 RepID=A0A5N7D8C5_9EURO|nr:uncharacterized protein BDV37DRAFT_253506 [Aspergillus pseudonomiae]KAE8402018.1 hypothetical protein BDV37DRAFT_253506 [Aspergillus pseudonomiae]